MLGIVHGVPEASRMSLILADDYSRADAVEEQHWKILKDKCQIHQTLCIMW